MTWAIVLAVIGIAAITPSACFFLMIKHAPGNLAMQGNTLGVANAPDNSDQSGDEWPMFHGALNHTGMVMTSPVNGTSTLWSYTTGGEVLSSPAIAGGRVYVGSSDKNVICLNATTGGYLWNYPTGRWVSSTPAVAGGRVYVGSGDHQVYCFDATDGTKYWNYTTGDSVDSSPAVWGGFVYVGSLDMKIYCLNATTGLSNWTYDTGSIIPCSPSVVNGRVYVGTFDTGLFCLNTTTGGVIWSNTTIRSGGYASPTVANGRLYCGAVSGEIYCLNATDGASLWNFTTGGSVSSTLAMFDGRVFTGNDKLYCLNATTGASIWNCNVAVSNSPAVANGCVYMGVSEWVYAVNISTGEVVWQYRPGMQGITSIAIANGRLFVTSYDFKLYCLPMILMSKPNAPRGLQAFPGDGEVLLTWQPPTSNGSAPIVNFRIYQGTAPGAETLRATVGNVSSYLATNLTNGQVYYFNVATMNAAGSSPNATEVSATPATLPSAPQALSAAAGLGQVMLTWEEPLDSGGPAILGYIIFQGTASGEETFLDVVVGNVTNWTVTGLGNGQLYYFKVAAINIAGWGANSTEISVTTLATVPTAPQSLNAAARAGQILLTWASPASTGGSPITGYRIYLGTASGGETLLAMIGNETVYTVTNLTNDQIYYFKVAAVNAVGEGPLSIEASATPSRTNFIIVVLAITGGCAAGAVLAVVGYRKKKNRIV